MDARVANAEAATSGTDGQHADDAIEMWRLAYSALDVARTLVNAPSAALLARHGADLHLLALRGIDQRGLDLLEALWRRAESRLLHGYPYGQDDPPLVALPFADAAGAVGLVLFMWPAGQSPSAPAVLEPLARVLAALLRRVRPGDSAGVGMLSIHAATEPCGVALLALLEQHDWNVSRVARTLGVSRMTVYNRMRRYGIPRERARLTHPRTVAARVA